MGLKGYRELSEDEIKAINDLKELEQHIVSLIEEYAKNIRGVNKKSLTQGGMDILTGFMWLTRAIARPNGE